MHVIVLACRELLLHYIGHKILIRLFYCHAKVCFTAPIVGPECITTPSQDPRVNYHIQPLRVYLCSRQSNTERTVEGSDHSCRDQSLPLGQLLARWLSGVASCVLHHLLVYIPQRRFVLHPPPPARNDARVKSLTPKRGLQNLLWLFCCFLRPHCSFEDLFPAYFAFLRPSNIFVSYVGCGYGWFCD